MPGVAALGGLLCVLVIGVAVGMLVGAVILRAAIALYNKIAGGASSPSGVPEPEFGKAMGITFVTSLVQMVVGFLIGLVTSSGAANAGLGGRGIEVVAELISSAVGLMIMAGMLATMLPTTFVRGLLIALCYMVVVVLIVAIFVGIALVVGIAMRAT